MLCIDWGTVSVDAFRSLCIDQGYCPSRCVSYAIYWSGAESGALSQTVAGTLYHKSNNWYAPVYCNNVPHYWDSDRSNINEPVQVGDWTQSAQISVSRQLVPTHSAQSNQRFSFPTEETLDPCLPIKSQWKTLTKLRGCTGRSESSIGAHANLYLLKPRTVQNSSTDTSPTTVGSDYSGSLALYKWKVWFWRFKFASNMFHSKMTGMGIYSMAGYSAINQYFV